MRFINHASRILSDPEHRQHYDQELAVTGEANTEQRISRFVSNVAATAEQEGTAEHDEDEVIEAADEKLLTASVGAPDKSLHHPGLTERVASFGRSAMGQLALCLLFGAFIAGAIVFVTPADSVLVAKQVLVWLTLLLLVLSLVYGVVHGLSWLQRRPRAAYSGADSADRSRDSQLAPREERISRHRRAAGRRELDIPAAHGRARAGEVGTHQRAPPVEPPGGAPVRLRDLGTGARAAAVGTAQRRHRQRRESPSGSAIRCWRRC